LRHIPQDAGYLRGQGEDLRFAAYGWLCHFFSVLHHFSRLKSSLVLYIPSAAVLSAAVLAIGSALGYAPHQQ
jgi:hypothetical protein